MLKVPFSPPDITEEEIYQVVEALRSGWITTGPKTKEFERQITALVHASRAVCLNSATACMELALRKIRTTYYLKRKNKEDNDVCQKTL